MSWTDKGAAATFTIGVAAALAAAGLAPSAVSMGAQPTLSNTPLGRTGGFGEPTCVECHSEFELNPEGGSLEVTGLPTVYESGRRYPLTVVLEGEGMTKGGYQAAVRFSLGPRAGQQAGVLVSPDTRSEVRDSVGISYGQHTAQGAEVTSRDRIEWTIHWTAPDDTSRVVLHVSANSANGDASPLGDWVLALERPVMGQPSQTAGSRATAATSRF